MDSIKKPKSRLNSIDILIAENLRRKRTTRGISQIELAKTISVSVQQIQKYEHAKNRISSGNLFYFAKFLKVPISYFYSVEKEPEL